ncbi:MAG: DUF1318 domain-containing protein [Verrucomicrobia bacterium]|jgi:uncharacterized protein YdbL (DUF1318 family)|nr:DUF1318 domain-containing protein [Verrucomicrobiota bacterium]
MSFLRFTVLIVLLLSSSLPALSANLGEVKSAMKARQPAIEVLWAEGKIGENNQGFINARGNLSEKNRELVAAENSDRKVVYQAIARSTQSTPKQVGVQRAAQISKRAAPGLWLQDSDGNWYRK